MTEDWCPVLAVADPAGALDWFSDLPSVTVDHKGGVVRCGPIRILVTAPDAQVSGFLAVPFDHLALRADDVDATLAQVLGHGARLHPGFTPGGPREIAAFGPTGVRYVFVIGPGGVPVEFCAPLGVFSGRPGLSGLDHLGVRTTDVGATCATILARRGEVRARHVLTGTSRSVEVCFIMERNLVWEVFDEAPEATHVEVDPPLGWIGIAARDLV